jgi:twinkle protein
MENKEKVESFKYYPHRGISEQTLRFYGVRTRLLDNEPHTTAFPYLKGMKLRSMTEKKFWSEGDMKASGLFGKDKFDPGSKDSITITEGEYDALSVYECLRHRTAACSIRAAGAAYRDCVTDREYINSFNKIYLCFDNDEPGQKAAQEVSSLFDFTKVYHVKFTKYKDANEYLQNGEADNLRAIWENAKRYSPDNIISSFKDIEEALEESKEDEIGSYPFKSLQSSLYGLHRGEVVVFKGMSGIGKTEVFRAMEHHLLKTTKSNIGIIHMEEDNATTVKAIAGYELGIRATVPDCGLSNSDILQGYRQAVSDDDKRVHLYSSFDLEDEGVLLDNIRFLGTAAACDFIFLDHITWLATGLEKEDERLKLDRISQKLKLLAKELRFCLCMISHTNDEGRTRGSRNIENVANTIVHLERSKESPDYNTRHTTNFTVVKARLGGNTGPCGSAVLDNMSGKLVEWTDEQLQRVAREVKDARIPITM